MGDRNLQCGARGGRKNQMAEIVPANADSMRSLANNQHLLRGGFSSLRKSPLRAGRLIWRPVFCKKEIGRRFVVMEVNKGYAVQITHPFGNFCALDHGIWM